MKDIKKIVPIIIIGIIGFYGGTKYEENKPSISINKRPQFDGQRVFSNPRMIPEI